MIKIKKLDGCVLNESRLHQLREVKGLMKAGVGGRRGEGSEFNFYNSK